MNVEVLYFAGVRDLVGTPKETLSPPATVTTVESFAAWLQERHPELSGRLTGVRFAVNEEFAADADAIRDGDVIAVIPPVAGG